MSMAALSKTLRKKERWDANYHASLPLNIAEILANPSADHVFLSDVAELSSERSDPRRWGRNTFSYIEISDVNAETCMVTAKKIKCSEAPTRARRVVHTGDILFSTVRPERRTVARVTKKQDGAICTTGFAVLRPICIDSLVLAHLLRTDFVCMQVMRNNIGIAYPAIDESCLPSILLPVTLKDVNTFQDQAEAVALAESRLDTLRSRFREDILSQIAKWEHENS